MWQDWLMGVLGIVVLTVGYMTLTTEVQQWTLTVVGIAIILLSIWSVAQKTDTRHE